MAHSVKSKDQKREVKVEKSFGASLRESVEKYGEEVVHKAFVEKATNGLLAKVKMLLSKNKGDEEIHKAISEYIPKIRKAATPMEVAAKALGISAEVLEAALAKMQK